MTRIVRTAYRYKRPPRRKKPVVLEVPAVITTKSSRRPIRVKAAAEMQLAPVSKEKQGAVQPSTPREAARVAQSAILTIRRQTARIIPPGLLAETPEEHRRRGDAADAIWRALVRRVAGKQR
jgi:hypothetical protein